MIWWVLGIGAVILVMNVVGRLAYVHGYKNGAMAVNNIVKAELLKAREEDDE